MKRFLATTALTALLYAPAASALDTLPSAGSADTARIITLVASIPMAVDLADYDLAKAAFAPDVLVDDSSLWGGAPNTMTPAELMTGWRGIVPGVDATWHELSPATVTLEGTTATATALVDGRHWIGDEIWRPVGDYHWDPAQIDGDWRVTRMEFDMTHEIGDRSLATKAMERVAASH